MELLFDKDKLEKLLKSFSDLTGLRIVMFDNSFQEVISYPPINGPFCQAVQQSDKGRACCEKSNQEGFRHCMQDNRLYTYECHAGLIESMINLRIDGNIVGYIMFGQVSHLKNNRAKQHRYLPVISSLDIPESVKKQLIAQISHKSVTQVEAASSILLVLAKHTINEKIVAVNKNTFINNIDAYINGQLNLANISVTGLAEHLNIGRTKLYELSKRYLNTSIAQYIFNKRLEKAYEYLRTTDLSITQIASKIGFIDYNYFCRVFRKQTGMSARTYRKQYTIN